MQQEFADSLDKECRFIGQVRTTRYNTAKDKDGPAPTRAKEQAVSRVQWQRIFAKVQA